LPVDRVIVEVAVCIRQTSVSGSVRCVSWDDTLPEEVALCLRGRRTGELPIDFVLDITHRNKGSDNPSPAASLEGGSDRPVVDISCAGETCAAVGLGKDHRQCPIVVLDGPFVDDPVVFRGVSVKQSVIGENAGLIRERELPEAIVLVRISLGG